MKYIRPFFENNTDDNDLSQNIRDILADASDMNGVINIEYKWTRDESIGEDTYHKSHSTEFSKAHRIYEIEVEFETRNLPLTEVAKIMTEMDDVSHKLKMISEEYKMEWMVNHYGSDDNDVEGSQILRFRIHLISKGEVAQTDIVGEIEEVTQEFLQGSKVSAEVIRHKDVVRVTIMDNDLAGNPATKAERDRLDDKRFRKLKRIHQSLSTEIKSKIGQDIRGLRRNWYDWGVRKVGIRTRPYFFVKINI